MAALPPSHQASRARRTPLVLSAILLAAAEPWTSENSAWNVNTNPAHEPWNYHGEWPGHQYHPSPEDWRAVPIYQLITDRFVDGDPRNNELVAGGFDVRDMTFRHGGDYVGLTRKLHYIKGLGIKGIWISPIFQNGFNSYHQYSQHDFTVLDRRLGTLEELRSLVTEAHRLGMYVLVDVVMNHMANLFFFEGSYGKQAPFRIHENSSREYRLIPNIAHAARFDTGIWCGGFPRWQEYGENMTDVLQSQGTCEARCADDPGCFFYLWKDDFGSLSRFHCAGFSRCDSPSNYSDGNAAIYKMPTSAFALNSWCGEAPLWQELGNRSSGILQNITSCRRKCESDSACSFYLWKDDHWARDRYHCAGFSTQACETVSEYAYGASKVFKVSADPHQRSPMFSTPMGKQPYADFWYNNSWVPEAQYNGTYYDWDGEPHLDTGFGTYDNSDFHHNGDLVDYSDPWIINLGKIYGTMDDLRLEHWRVQEKYLAMTKALMSSTDVDGFRCDTPMQVPLNFFKTWAPAVREHARSLGKTNFGLFGEFYVTTQRYATMMGRGKDYTMYGQERFIDQVYTLNGGITYPYYWYVFSALVYNKAEFADGFRLAYEEETKCVDTYNPSTGRKEYAQWTFCNNHDNWRLQSMVNRQALWLCLAVITFWPGVPLHYAGDEQDFDTPGSALDGWAREELSISLAWRGLRGNRANGDNFDMTSPSYRYISRLNALRRAYFGHFGKDECDEVQVQAAPNVTIFTRGCNSSTKVVCLANFHKEEAQSLLVQVPWPSGTRVVDGLVANSEILLVDSSGSVPVTLAALEAKLLVTYPMEPVPLHVVSVTPPHGSTVQLQDEAEIIVTLVFDRDLPVSVKTDIRVAGLSSNASCSGASCSLQVQVSSLTDGLHYVEVPEGPGGLYADYRSFFIIDRQNGSIAWPDTHAAGGLICADGSLICHKATGASWLRIQNVGEAWSAWRPYEKISQWRSTPGLPVLVQYHAEGSASFVAGDCLAIRDNMTVRCHASWHKDMLLKGDLNDWGQASEKENMVMQPVDHFTWGITVELNKSSVAKFVPSHDSWDKAYGIHPDRKLIYGLPFYDSRDSTFSANRLNPWMSGTEASRVWMRQRGRWSEHESLASGTSWSGNVLLHPECKLEGIESRSTVSGKCCILFNDLLLNYTVTSDLSRCAPVPPEVRGFNPSVDDFNPSDNASLPRDGLVEDSSSGRPHWSAFVILLCHILGLMSLQSYWA